jgi:GH15 family glucan-1,4-alpha-glucosidase
VLVAQSIALIEQHQHPGGAYPACPTYPVYNYSWLRDGSFIADAMSRAGRPDSADAFHRWVAGVIEARAGRIADLVAKDGPISASEMLPTRYTLDGQDGSEEWWDYQLDGYGTWLWAVVEHARRHGRSLAPYAKAMASTVDYLRRFGTDPCYDWWEEHASQTHTSTLASVAAGLRAAGEPVAHIERLITGGPHLTKWLGSDAVDGSLLACMVPFGVVPAGGELAERTYERIRAELLQGGVYRYRGDTFYGGGEWLILTAWLGWYEAETGRLDLARRRKLWIEAQATVDGFLPEQVSGHAQDPSYIDHWTGKWGTVATPLLWSHAMYITLATELGSA